MRVLLPMAAALWCASASAQTNIDTGSGDFADGGVPVRYIYASDDPADTVEVNTGSADFDDNGTIIDYLFLKPARNMGRWRGAAAQWSTRANWGFDIMPNEIAGTKRITIVSSANNPLINGSTSAGDLSVDLLTVDSTGAPSLLIDGATFTVGTAVEVRGAVTVQENGGTAGALLGGATLLVATTTDSNGSLTITNNASATFGASTVNRGGTVTITNGALTTTTLTIGATPGAGNAQVVLNSDSASLTATAVTIEANGSLTANNDAAITADSVTINNGGSMVINNTADLAVDAITVGNGGTLTITGTSAAAPASVQRKGATQCTITVQSGGTLDIDNFSLGFVSIVVESGAVVAPIASGVFQQHPSANGAAAQGYLDVTAYTGGSDRTITLIDVSFNNSTNVTSASNPYNIKAAAGSAYVVVTGMQGRFAGEEYELDPGDKVFWFTASPERDSSVGGIQTLMTTAVASSTGAGASVTVQDNIPEFGGLTLDAGTMGSATDVTIKRAQIVGNVVMNAAGKTVTLENCMIAGDVSVTLGTLNLVHCTVKGNVAAGAVSFTLATGTISPVGTENFPSAALGNFADVTNADPAKWDLHLAQTPPNAASIVDQAASSTTTVDFDGMTRAAPRDIGADEASATNVGRLMWDLSTTLKLGPVNFITPDVYYRLLFIGTGRKPGNADATMWENSLLVVNMADGALMGAMCGAGTLRAAGAGNSGAANWNFPNNANFYLPGSVHSLSAHFDTSGGAGNWVYRIHLTCDGDGDGYSDTVRRYHVPIPTAMPSTSNHGGAATAAAGYRYSSAVRTWGGTDFTVVGGPISTYFAYQADMTNLVLAANNAGTPTLYKVNTATGGVTSSTTVLNYNPSAGVVSYSGGEFFTGLAATGTAADVDLAQVDNTLAATQTTALKTGPGADIDGLTISPRAGFMGQDMIMVASADEWLRRFARSTMLIDTGFGTNGILGLEFDNVSVAGSSTAMFRSPELYANMQHYIVPYTTTAAGTGAKRSYLAKLDKAGGAPADSDWTETNGSRPAMRGKMLGDLMFSGNVIYAATDEGFLYALTWLNGNIGAGNDNTLVAGYPLRIPGVGLKAAATSFHGTSPYFFSATRDNRVLAHKLQ